MASFSEKIKIATSTAESVDSGVAMSNIMTLEEPFYDGLAYSGETWTPDTSGNYRSTDDYTDGKRYEDSDISYVDEKKVVTINENQINLTQEENSQYIPFEMFRYYDGIDLKNMVLYIFYVNEEGDYGESKPINVRYSDTKIRFGFLVPKEATAIKGTLKLEIQARGASPLGGNYLLKTKPNEEIKILESLQGNGNIIVDEEWATNVLEDVKQAANDAQSSSANARNYAEQAQNALSEINDLVENTADEIADQAYGKVMTDMETEFAKYYTKDEITEQLGDYALNADLPTKVSELENDAGYLTEHQSLEGYATEKFVIDKIADADISDKLKDYVTVNVFDSKFGELVDVNGNELTVVEYVRQEVEAVDISDQIGDTGTNEDGSVKTVVQYVNDAVASVDVSEQLNSYYTKEQADLNFASKSVETDVNTNKSDIQTVNTAITSINATLDSIDKSPNARYYTTYNEPYSIEGTEYTGENTLVVYEVFNKDTESETKSVVSSHVITGGGGGSASSNIIKIERITNTPLVVTANDKVIIEYTFVGTDSSGEDIGQGKATWKVGSKVVKTENIYTGENSVDLTEFLSVASDQKITLIITDDIGTASQKTWYVSVVDVKLESTFDDTRTYSAGSAVSFTYTPYGAVDKTVHFVLDGKEIGTTTSAKAAAGLSTSYSVPAQEHGTHLFEIYMTATINNNDVESNHIVKDIIWYDVESNIPVISTVSQKFTAKQYATTNISYTVYDPSTETPTVTLKATYVDEEGNTVETYNTTLTLTSNTDIWAFKTDVIGTHTLTITCGETVKTLIATIEDIGIEVEPTTAGLEFDFNPVGYSNNDANRIWTDSNTGVNMTVSENFDWVNGGYQMDDVGDQYFCVKAGTTATINYNLFADDAKENGKEFKVIFKTTNVKNRNTSFISCMDSGIGLDMKVEDANIYSSNGSLYSPYCEEDIIEFEFNINKNTDIPMVLTYEDGVGNRPMIYTSDSSFWQTNPVPITIGCENCDVHIYRMKAYSTSLSDKDILNNFIADARSAEEMISRYNRNQIYKEGALDPEYLAEVCPDLRIILVDTPWFTNDKDNKIDDTNITMIYKNGDPVLDNWTCTGARHRGQGTSSNEYGYAGRNIDLVMDTDTSLFTLGDGKTTSSTITLTRDSVPTDYLNVKVNIASSENQNNAQMARNYSLFNPFIRFARWKDSKVKDCMEFFNCVVFVRERNEDISTHREFQDTDFHFYAIGNVGDSKKTDKTRVNDKNDPKECIIEITDYNVPLAEFPTGYGENNKGICPESEWKAGNTAYDFLYSEYEYEDGEFKSFGAGSYEFRYEMKKITDEQRQENIDIWREFYKFVATSSNEDFYTKLKEWFVVDSALYFYLFTERYTMVDNRAKNCFLHYGKVYITETEAETLGDDAAGYIIDNEQAAIRNGYRYDLSQGYDFDTSLGIDNTGKLVLTYGKEDTDFYVDGDSESGYIYRAAESTFFSKIRDLFSSELQAMFVDRENQNTWSSSRLITQWDNAQAQFPEELWRLDIQRKYFRTYQGISIDNSFAGEANPRFLTEMLNGRKKYQRRMFERNQELYMATKYFGKTATQDQIMMRFNNPVGAAISPDFTLYITPYSDMYIGTSFGNVTPTNFRAKAGIEYTVPCSIESGTADITLIYGASFIQAIGDLSRCYVGDNDFSKASRLQSLVIGSNTEGYSNSFMTKIALGNNKLLEYLDIRNITGLNSVVDLSNCGNLIELRAENSGATGVIFANGGKVEKAYIPAVTSLTAKNLNYLEEFVIQNYDKLQTLIVENTPFLNTLQMVDISSTLKVLRLIGLNWSLENTNILDRIMTLRGVSNTGGEISNSVLSGYVYVPGIKQYDYYKYKEQWNDLEIEYGSMTPQFVVTFVNDDGTVLDIQYVDQYTDAKDPITRADNPIPTPTKASTISTEYTFKSWDRTFTSIGNNITVTATYTERTRQYSVKYVQTFGNKTEVLQESLEDYGSYCFYEGANPTYTSEEQYSKFYLFNRWDKSGYVDGNKVITAVYDSCYYSDDTYFNGKDLTDLTNAEIYALTKLMENGRISISTDENSFEYISGTNIYAGDAFSFNMGHDYDYDDLADKTYTIVDIDSPRTFTGASGDYLDTGYTVLDMDRDFVIAVDYEFASNNDNNAVLMECYDQNNSRGFKLSYVSGNPTINWWSSGKQCATSTNREMLILRHVAGETGLHVYTSNLSGASTSYISLTSEVTTTTSFSLIFGCGRRTSTNYSYYAKGTIHWAKLWYADLGEQACEKLASYIHENISLKIAGFNRYFLENGEQLSSIDFIADKVLYTQKTIHTGTNVDGWASSPLNTWLNSRFYNGIPVQMQQLLKKVKVKSRKGDKSNDSSHSYCYVYIPAVSELLNYSPYNASPYTGESDAVPICIPHITSTEDRIMKDSDGTAVEYWTRSPSDGGIGNVYFFYISTTGSAQPIGLTTTTRGVVIEFSI